MFPLSVVSCGAATNTWLNSLHLPSLGFTQGPSWFSIRSAEFVCIEIAWWMYPWLVKSHLIFLLALTSFHDVAHIPSSSVCWFLSPSNTLCPRPLWSMSCTTSLSSPQHFDLFLFFIINSDPCFELEGQHSLGPPTSAQFPFLVGQSFPQQPPVGQFSF